MTSKQDILNAIRQQRLPDADLPSLDQPVWIRYPDRQRQFAETLEAVGGRCLMVRDAADLQQQLEALPAYAEAPKQCCLVPGLPPGNVDPDGIDDPHRLEDVDVAVLPGQFGVAENAAVYVTAQGLKHRVLYFIVQHLVLVVPADQIVDNLHQAYRRLPPDQPGFAVFISGPSKTADIEQSLVIGAHGPRSLTVLLLQEQIAN